MEGALEAATAAGDAALGWFRKPLDVELKADGSPVTRADHIAEMAAVTWIERRFPEDGIWSEEIGLIRPEASRRWVIDPIDGTMNFLRGVPLWGSLVAVAERDQVVAGAACFPAIRETIAAAKEEGAWHDGVRVTVSRTARLSDAALLTTDTKFAAHRDRGALWSALAQEAALVRTWGDCYGYLMVATGRADVMVDDVAAPWDLAAMQPIIEEAGGVFTDWQGERSPWKGDAIATNAALSTAVRQRLRAGVPA